MASTIEDQLKAFGVAQVMVQVAPHVGAAAPHALGGRLQVAPRRGALADRHRVFEIDDDGVGAALVRAVDEARHVCRHVQRRAPDRQLAIGGVAHITFLSRRLAIAAASRPSRR